MKKKMKKKKNRLTKKEEKHDIHITWWNGGSEN